MSIERSAQQSAQDTLRWGDSKTFANLSTTENVNLSSKQLVAAHWRWPLTWKLMVAVVPAMVAAETAIFTLAIRVTVGSGQGTTTVKLPLIFVAPSAGPGSAYLDQTFFFDIPAQDIQVEALLTGTANQPGDSVTVGVYVAPVTEAHAMTHMLDGFAKDERFGRGEREGGWMPPGFHPEPLQYGR